ncbi:DUF4157 domain-containing protein [Umezawaea endophytica]|uniref:DUF4157 domain-containing protein n=1 Tax=Umezawaea endophytica TaxID=1654476 RepID=A0A9X2VL08_9PSEU|nr:DUF4157 domain-containing protein [Umezawaea endophytica]MCS7477113.1 DUF4157 domain-containing protein [Umezawaea endophytica]
MWWPFRGKRPRRPSPTADSGPTLAWRRLPVLRTVITGLPRTAVVLMRMPDVAGTRSVLPELRLRRRRPAPTTGRTTTTALSTVDSFAVDTPVLVGRATGLLVIRPEPLAPAPEPEPAPPPPVDQDGLTEPALPIVPPVRRPAVPRRPAAPALTTASVEFVSEPVEPDSPFRSVTDFDRLAAQYEAMGIETAMSVLGLGDASGLAALSAPPPPPPEPVKSTVDPPRVPRARPTLGQSRRRGVGLPAAREDAGAPAEPFTPNEVPPAAAPTDVDTTVDPPTSQSRAHAPAELTVPPAEPMHPVATGDGRPDDRRTNRTVVQPPLFTSPAKAKPADPPPPRPPVRTPPPDRAAPPRQATREPLPATAPVTDQQDGPIHRAPINRTPPPFALQSNVDDPFEPPVPIEVVAFAPREHGTDSAEAPTLTEQVLPRQTTYLAEPEAVEVRVPSDVVTAFRRDLGVDIADVPVRSGRAVTRRAAALGARAFTQGGRVHLPHAVATMDRGDTRALLAHELVHVVQQRALGADMPGEDSAHGQELEAVARSAERWFLGEEQAPAPLVHRTRPTTSAPPNATESLQRAPRPTATNPVHDTTDPVPENPAMSWTPETGFTESRRPDAPAHHRADPDAAGLAEAFTQIADLRSTLAELRREREPSRDESPQDRTSHPDTDALADRLYRHIRSRLRSELLIDRERTGSLADPGPGGHR